MTRSIRTARTTGILTALVLTGAGLVAAPAAGAPGGDVVATAADPAGERTFYNPIKTGADPSIYRHDGEYVFAESVNDQGIALRRSATLTGLGSAARQVVWTAPPTGPLCCEVWAPEVLRVRGDWYVYFAADDGDNANHRMYAIKALTQDPFGPWSEPVRITDATDRWGIDATVMEVDGQLYYLWSGWEGTENVEQRLYIATMSDPLTIDGPRIELSRPDQPWERLGEVPGELPAINEGPEVLQRNGRIHIVYSASGSWTPDYCLGMLTHESGDLLDPATWTKSDGCVFSKRDTAHGPGHHTFTTSPDGTEDWILYHANTVAGSGWGGRSVRAQKFTWDEQGPVFGSPTSTYDPIPVPSGENSTRYVTYEAEDGRINRGQAVTVSVPGASGGQKVGYLDFADSWVEWDVTVPTAGRYDVLVRYGNDPGNPAGTTQVISLDGVPAGTVHYPRTAWDNWTFVTVPLDLPAGTTTVRLTKGDGYTELDLIRIPLPDTVPTPLPDADYTVAAACLGSTAVVSVRLRNTAAAAADVTVFGAVGSKSFTGVRPGGLIAANFAAGAAVEAGTLTVETVVDGVRAAEEVGYGPRTC